MCVDSFSSDLWVSHSFTASFLLGVGVCIVYFCCVAVYLSPFLSSSQKLCQTKQNHLLTSVTRSLSCLVLLLGSHCFSYAPPCCLARHCFPLLIPRHV